MSEERRKECKVITCNLITVSLSMDDNGIVRPRYYCDCPGRAVGDCLRCGGV